MSFAQHIIQRSRDQAACFSCPDDRLAYLAFVVALSAHYESVTHAYVLMANHVHLLVTTREAEEFAHAIRESYQGHVADTYGVDARAWDEDPEIRPVHARRYLLGCMRYIELNPVRARIVARPEDYRWSSYRANALSYKDPLVTPHPLYYALGRTPAERCAAYARFVDRNRFGTASP